jgi:hypothetical protein
VEEVERGSCVGMYAHKLACSSAYFDAGGTKIVSTSYDDLVRVWEVEPSTKASWLTGGPSTAEVPPTFSARHDNQTGRWVSVSLCYPLVSQPPAAFSFVHTYTHTHTYIHAGHEGPMVAQPAVPEPLHDWKHAP